MIDWSSKLKLSELEVQHGLPSGLLSAVMAQESGGNPNAISPKGASGLFQFMPATAKAYGIDPTDPMQAAQGAARMYGDLNKQYSGDLPKMLAAYNWGSGNLAQYGLDRAPEETRNYIAKIQGRLGTQVANSGETMSDALPEGFVIDNVNAGLPEGFVIDAQPTEQPMQTDADMQATLRDQLLQGATFGFGDEAQATLAAGALTAMNGKPFAENYDAALKQARGNVAAQQKENPTTSFLAQLAGGVGGTGAAVKGLAAIAPKAAGAATGYAAANPFKSAVGTGAASGGLYGFGTGEGGTEERGTNALLGGAVGGVAGAVLQPFINRVVSPALSKLASTKQPTQPASALTQLADDQTIQPLVKKSGDLFSKTAGQRTQNTNLQRLESEAGAGLLTPEAQAAVQAAQTMQNREYHGLINSLAGGKLDKAKDINTLLEGISDTVRTGAQAKSAAVDSAYKLAREGQDAVKIGRDAINQGLWRNVASIRREGGYDLSQMPKAQSVLKRLAKYSQKTDTTNITAVKLGELENFRKMASNAAYDMRGTSEGRFLKQMVNQYDNFMRKTADDAVNMGDSNAINAFRTAVKERSEYGRLFESNKLIEGIVDGSTSVDDTVKSLIGTGAIKGKRGMEANFDAIIKAAQNDAPAVKADLQQAFMQNVFKKVAAGFEEGNINMERISPAKLATELDSLFVNQSAFAKKLFGEDAVKTAQQAIKELKIIANSQPQVKNASGSGETMGRFIKALANVPVVNRVTAPVARVGEMASQQKGAAEVMKGLNDFVNIPVKPMAKFWGKEVSTGTIGSGAYRQIQENQ